MCEAGNFTLSASWEREAIAKDDGELIGCLFLGSGGMLQVLVLFRSARNSSLVT